MIGKIKEYAVFWGKKQQETPKPAQPVRAPLSRPVTQPASASHAVRPPRQEMNRPVTVQDLPEMLLAHANVTREQLQQALEVQRKSGEFIGEILVNLGALDENSLVAFLAKYCKIPHLSLLDYLIDESLLELVPPEFCLRYRLVPIDKMGRNLTVAMVNPLDSLAMGSLQERCPDLRIKPILCTTKHFDAVTGRLFDRKSVQQNYPRETEASPEEKKPIAASVPPESLPVTGLDLHAAGMVVSDLNRLPVGTAPFTEEELPPAGGFNDLTDVFDPPPVEKDAHEALLDSVFALNSDGMQEESGDGMAPDGSVIVGKMTRKMTSAMVNSMRNTYAVLARRVSLFRGLDPEAVAKLFARGKTVEYEAGLTIFHKGDEGRIMYVILSGAVDIIDEDRILAHLDQGQNFGEMALLANTPRSATAQTVASTSLLMLSFADITQDLDSATSVQLLVNITVTLSSRLRKAQSL